MIPKRRVFLITVVLLTLFIITTNYFVTVLNGANKKSEAKKSNFPSIEDQILQWVPYISSRYKNKRNVNDSTTYAFIRNLKMLNNVENKTLLWEKAASSISKSRLFDVNSSHLGTITYAMKTAKIIKADVDSRGTQLKLLLTLEGNQQVVFKPKWYPIDKIIEGPVYAGKDRYFSEIVAFYLSAILEKPLVPIATERKVSIAREIAPVASDSLLETIYGENSITCLFGKCFYCKRSDPVCEDASGLLSGAVILNVNANFKNNRSPWQRTYKKDKKAAWETNVDYCKSIRSKLSLQRLLNLIDVSIFDFLIQNGDRHHYETLGDTVILLDNGKGLGNPHFHHINILAPLYQCCLLKSSTLKRLEQLSGGFLREQLEAMPGIRELITKEHLNAIEERLIIVYATVEYCKSKNKFEYLVP